MRWFSNLNATPRLMVSFGVLILMAVGIGYVGISNLGKSNDRLESMYKDDMAGSRQANQIAKDRLSLGRESRDALLHINEPAVVASYEKAMLGYFTRIHSTLDEMDKTFYSKEGQEIVGTMRSSLPAYEKGYQTLYERIDAKDYAGSLAAMNAVTETGRSFFESSERAIAVKVKLGEEKYEANGEAYRSTRTLIVSATILAALFGLILSFVIARGFSVPLGHAVETLERVAEGDMTASLDIDTKDEVGRMASALNLALQKLNATLQEVSDSANHASSSAQELSAAAESIAAGAQEQAASLEETSASLEEITATVRQSADNAHQASQLASGSRDSAERGQEVVSAAITAMSEINAASAKISDIISTIDEIAFQTNLLAVNAAVEAARAG